MSSERPYDILIHGATGYTGILISEYFAKHVASSDPSIRWAIVGRDIDKLLGLIKYLTARSSNPKLHSLKYFVLQDGGVPELVDIFKQAKVIINCVGPFFKFGEPVVEACLQAHTHYTDITGEPHYIRHILAKFNEEAKSKKIVIVPAAGFDSVPADMCVFMAQKRSESPLTEVRLYIEPLTGGMSYGTISTFIESLSRGPKKGLTEQGEGPKVKPIQKMVPHRASRIKHWVVPFNFSSDPYVVTLSTRLRNQKQFAYAQYLQIQGFFEMIFYLMVAFFVYLFVKIPGGGKFLLSLQKKGFWTF
jgi:short subunit dehydrogenase-like uncharacterized protein